MNVISLKKVAFLMIFVSCFVNSCPTRYGLNCLKDPNSHQKMLTELAHCAFESCSVAKT